MIIPITLPSPSPNSPKLPLNLAKLGNDEVVLIELQGSLEVEGDGTGQRVGKLQLGEDASKPTLLIGHHLLEGNIVTLQKPLAVLHRTGPKSDRKDMNEDEMDVDEREGCTEQSKGIRYDMVGLVRRKIVFAKRPMPVVNAAAVKEGMEKGVGKDEAEGKRKRLKLG